MSTSQRPSRKRTCRVSRTCSTTGVPPSGVSTRLAVTITYAPVAERGASGDTNATGAEHTADWRAATTAAHDFAEAGAVNGSKPNHARSVIAGCVWFSRVPNGDRQS